jgi:uncharacterized protein YndB with AHSA1/START domain
LDGVVGLTQRTEHPVGDRPQVSPVGFEPLRHPVMSVHRSHFPVAFRHISVESNATYVTGGGTTMPAIVSRVQIDRPPSEVFSYVTDPSRFPEWQHDIVRVHPEEDRAPGLGWRFTTTRRIGGVERTMTQEVMEIDPPRSWAVHGIDGPIRPSASITVEPLDGGVRSLVTFALDFEGHGIGRPLIPAVRRQAAKQAPMSYRNLKERLERGDQPHRSAGTGA